MNITEVRITKLENSKALALASITIGEDFVVTGITVYNGNNGLWVSMPSRKNKDNEYKDIAYPITKSAREQIQSAVINKYQATNTFPSDTQKEAYNQVHKNEPEIEIDPNLDLPF